MTTRRYVPLVALLMIHTLTITAWAQGARSDARVVAMGGGTNSSNIAAGMVQPSTGDTVIPIPIGLIQVFRGGLDKFNPTSDLFDPVHAVEVTSSPMHYTFGQTSSGGPSQAFINDLVNGRLNPNLATYSGFHIPETLEVEGLAAPHPGGTIKFLKGPNRYHGIFIGAGPYFSVNTNLAVDPRLANLLGDGTPAPSSTMSVRDNSQVQLALAVTIGYRGRLPFGKAQGSELSRDGVYLAYNYHILKGFRYLQPDVLVRFDTNAAGSLVLTPTTKPFTVDSLQAKSGRGSASDIGVQIVRGHIEGGVGVNGIGNHIDWSDFSQSTFTLTSLTSGGDFVEVPGVPSVTSLKVKLPVVKTANVGFHGMGWGAAASVANGYNGTSAFAGVERQVGPLWLRGGGKRTRGKWDPTYGFGIGNKVALDVAFYGTHGNLEGKRLTAMAMSLRISHN